jgi:membrane protease YdiL (CAAX protease family)
VSTRSINLQPEGAVASVRHTAGFLLASLLLAIWGAFHSPIYEWPTTLASQHARLLLYVQILALQWLWVGYVWFGMRHSAISLRAVIDDSQGSGWRWLRYLAIGVAAWILYLALGAGLSNLLHPSPEALRGLQAMLPKAPVERMGWAAFAFTAGVCEEVVYRGYLLRQLRALTGNTFAALILQALCYSVVHLVLPIQMLVGVFALGLLLGVLAVWQKSLVPGMILHVGVGLAALVQPG